MRFVRKGLNICVLSFKQWVGDYRILMVFLAAFTYCNIVLKPVKNFLAATGVCMNAAVPVFLYNVSLGRFIFLLFFVVLLCDAPFINKTQQMIVLRSGRMSWGFGKILYIIAASALYIFSMYLFSWIILFPYIEFSDHWGKAVMTLAKTDASLQFGIGGMFKGKLVDYFSPSQALFFSVFLSLLAEIFLGMLLFVGNYISIRLRLGLVLSLAMVVFDMGITVSPVASDNMITYFSPVTWSSLSIINIGGFGRTPDIVFIMIMYGILLTVLFICSLICCRRKQMD